MSAQITPAGKKLFFLTILMGCLYMFSPIGIDMFLAGVPNIAKGLNTTPNQIINSISALLLGNALGQLILGPLSDQYGRKPIILLTLFLFSSSALASGLALSIEYFIFWGFIQGLAISTGRILAMSVARDLFDKEELGKMMANIMVIMGLTTIIFPILGGQIAQYFPWQCLFWIMVCFGSLVFLFTLFLQRNPQ